MWSLMDTNIASRILDQTKAVVSDAAVAGFLFFVVLPHKVGDTSWIQVGVNWIYFLKWLWKFCNFFFLLSLLGNFDA